MHIYPYNIFSSPKVHNTITRLPFFFPNPSLTVLSKKLYFSVFSKSFINYHSPALLTLSISYHQFPQIHCLSTYIHFCPLSSSRAFSSTLNIFSKAFFIPFPLLNLTPIHYASRSFLLSTSSPPFDTIQYYFCARSTFS